MGIEYRKTKRIDIKKWFLGGNSKIYLIILIVFLVVAVFAFNALKDVDSGKSGEEQSFFSIDEETNESSSKSDDNNKFIEDSQSYKIRINKSTHVLSVFKMLRDGMYYPEYTSHCAINSHVETGDTLIPGKQTWILNNDYSNGHYASLLGNGAYINYAPYWSQNKTSLSVTSYNNIGQTVSVGSIYLKASDAKWIYENCGINIPVEIYEDPEEEPIIQLEDFSKLPGSAYYDPSDKE